MDLNLYHSQTTHSLYSRQVEHSLQVIAAALSAACWKAYRGDILLQDGAPVWRWRGVVEHNGLDCGRDSPVIDSCASHSQSHSQSDSQTSEFHERALSSDELPHQVFPAVWRRLAERVQGSRSTAHELVLGSEVDGDLLGLHRLAWLVMQPDGACDCFEFLRSVSSDAYSQSDQRVLSVLTQEFILPLLSGEEISGVDEAHQTSEAHQSTDDSRVLDQIGIDLSRRQREVLAGLVAGQSVKEVACDLNLSPHTVNDYVKAIYRHFDVCSRGELLAVVHGRMRHALRSEIS